jgi:hypothetical protein
VTRGLLALLFTGLVVGDEGVAHAQEPDLAGTWALQYAVVSKAKVPVVGTIRSTSRTFVKVVITPQGQQWTQRHQVCGALVTGGPVRTVVPPAYIRHVARKTYPATTWQAAGTTQFAADTQLNVMGFDGTCGYVPTTLTDPCTVDTDKDGVPGVTVKAKVPLFPWVDVYMAQRNHARLHGTVTSPDQIDGHIAMTRVANNVLGASSALFAHSPTSEIVPDETRFRMTRVASGATCEDVLQHIENDRI